ncbi:MAG: peptidylprolyl isomerase [Clostridia bacterium]|nr:peptidylprolyl isomerase [Clostridia bacterium]
MKHIGFIILISCILCFSACSSDSDSVNNKDAEPVASSVGFSEPSSTSSSEPTVEHKRVIFEVENYGNFVIETFPEHAPDTVKHFLSLVSDGYYNGFAISQIIPGDIMLTSEESTETSSASDATFCNTVNGEFALNGRSNTLKLDKYTVALTHIPEEYDSGMAQFMIILSDNNEYSGKYAGFGRVVEGQDVIDKIVAASCDYNGKPNSPIVMKKVYINE